MKVEEKMDGGYEEGYWAAEGYKMEKRNGGQTSLKESCSGGQNSITAVMARNKYI